MSVSWTNEQELILIECYHAEPVLWDVKHEDHKNKTKVHDAWLRIKEIMNIEVTDLKKKKDCLKSSYRNYRKKVKDSLKSGASTDDVYKPIWFAFKAMDAFLGDGDICKKTIKTKEESVVKNEEVGGQQDVKSPNDKKKVSQTIRRRKNPSDLQDDLKVVQNAHATLKSTINRKESQPDEDDIYDLYGKMLAKKIKTLPEDDRLPFMYEIDGLFLRHQENNRYQYSILPNSTGQSTSTSLYGRPSTSHSACPEQAMSNSPSPVTADYINIGSRATVTSNEDY